MKNILILFFCILILLIVSGCQKRDLASVDLISITAVGDVNFGSDYSGYKTAQKNNRGFFKHCRKILRSADIAFCNLETVVCEKGKPAKKEDGKNTFVFRCPPEFAGMIADAGFDVVSIANNHIRDFGVFGENETKKNLEKNKIQFLSKDGKRAEFFIRGKSVCFTGFSSGFGKRSIVNSEEVFKEIRNLSERYDILVVSFHAGAEGEKALHTKNATEFFLGENRGNPVFLARGAIDNGADLILMHGPHVPRAIEIYKERLIAYSLGNFVNYGWSLNKYTGIAPLFWIELYPDGRLHGLKIYSFVQKKPGYPEFDRDFTAYKIIRELTEKDFNGTFVKFTELEEK